MAIDVYGATWCGDCKQHIPVVLYPDGTFQVEPSAVDIKNKLNELNIK